MAEDVAMEDMEIDFSMDTEEVDPEIARLQAEADAINARAEAADSEAMNGVEEVPEEGEVQATEAAPNKVHVRGLDRLSQNEVEQWAGEYYSLDMFKRVQWIDDTSANLMYETEVAAAEALSALSAEDVIDSLQLRPAKRFSAHPDMELQVRQAIVADVKMRGAKDRSKFYLFNKAWDPDNPDNVRPDNRKRRRLDDDRGDRKYRRRDYGRPDTRRSTPSEHDHFHEDMYDDGPKAAKAAKAIDLSRRNSYSSGGADHGRRHVNYDQDLVPKKDAGGHLRNRSASPQREGDGRYGFDEVGPRRRTARARSPTPPGYRGNIKSGNDNRAIREKLRTELFPNKNTSSALTNGGGGTNGSRELFPDKTKHRRQTAKHIHPDEVADVLGRRPDHSERRDNLVGGEGRDLFSRIKGGPQVESTYGRLRDGDNAGDFSFKGASNDGFNILGASGERTQNPLVKELFPLKAGGTDLFDGRIKGRASQRRRAEDLF